MMFVVALFEVVYISSGNPSQDRQTCNRTRMVFLTLDPCWKRSGACTLPCLFGLCTRLLDPLIIRMWFCGTDDLLPWCFSTSLQSTRRSRCLSFHSICDAMWNWTRCSETSTISILLSEANWIARLWQWVYKWILSKFSGAFLVLSWCSLWPLWPDFGVDTNAVYCKKCLVVTGHGWSSLRYRLGACLQFFCESQVQMWWSLCEESEWYANYTDSSLSKHRWKPLPPIYIHAVLTITINCNCWYYWNFWVTNTHVI